MDESLVVTLIGPDRPGIVARVAALAADLDAGWQESKMARLSGQFAGIVRLDVPAASVEALERSLRELQSEGLRLTVERAAGAAPTVEARGTALDLVGQDRRGIVRDISAVLARHRVGIEALDTQVESASMSGEQLFRARIRLRLPDGASPDAGLRTDLEAIADELMVDLTLDIPVANRDRA